MHIMILYIDTVESYVNKENGSISSLQGGCIHARHLDQGSHIDTERIHYSHVKQQREFVPLTSREPFSMFFEVFFRGLHRVSVG